jgi:hypothetical protein
MHRFTRNTTVADFLWYKYIYGYETGDSGQGYLVNARGWGGGGWGLGHGGIA